MASILAIGYNAFDVVCPLEEWPKPDSKCEVSDILLGGGGPAATAAVAMAKLGASVRLITPLADDLPGRLQRRQLLAAGVDIAGSPILSGCRSPKAVILVEPRHERRTILWSRGDLPHLRADQVSAEWLAGVDLVYADSHEPVAATILAQAARRRGLPVVLDAGTARAGMAELVSWCTDVISSSVFAPALTGLGDPAAALRAVARMGPGHVAMTFGRAGSLALDGDRLRHIPSFDVPVKDTTGAGDVFHAGFAYARAAGQAWLDCLVYGSAVAALKCRGWGGRGALPTQAMVAELIRSGRRRSEVPPGYPEGMGNEPG